MFDSRNPVQMTIMSGGEKRCVLRYPTDGEWCDASRKRRFVEQSLGRNKSQSRPVGFEEAAAEVFEKVRLDREGPPFDVAEAAAAIMKLEVVDVVDCEREGDEYRITLRCFAGQQEHEGKLVDVFQRVVHRLRIPLQADMLAHARAAIPPPVSWHRQRIFKAYLAPSGELWDKIGRAEAGYAEGSAVPITHKDAAVQELRAQFGMKEDDTDDPEL